MEKNSEHAPAGREQSKKSGWDELTDYDQEAARRYEAGEDEAPDEKGPSQDEAGSREETDAAEKSAGDPETGAVAEMEAHLRELRESKNRVESQLDDLTMKLQDIDLSKEEENEIMRRLGDLISQADDFERAIEDLLSSIEEARRKKFKNDLFSATKYRPQQ